MTERFPGQSSNEHSKENRTEEILALARALVESGETFPFPGLKPGEYEKLKAGDQDAPGYSTPIDEILERFSKEGMKVVFGDHPESGNVFILPSGSNDIQNDSISPRYLLATEDMNEIMRQLITKY